MNSFASEEIKDILLDSYKYLKCTRIKEEGDNNETMNTNQCFIEVVRDIAGILEQLESGKTVEISVARHSEDNMFDWESTNGRPALRAEVARMLRGSGNEEFC